MEKVRELLVDSFYRLWEEPVLFLPKLLSTFLSSIWFLGLVSGHLSMLQMAVLLPFVAFTGVFASLMVASMVKNEGSEKILSAGFFEALKSWRPAVSTSLVFLAISFAVSIPAGAGTVFYMSSGSFPALLTGIALSFGLVIGVSFVSYFLPITLLEKESLASGFSRSMETSRKRSRTVLLLVVFSIAMFGLAVGSTEYLQTLGYIGFVLGRLVSATVNTYLFVVSPSYYLENSS